jgi:beta-lactamase regulating signal transducer with metallopeptidase domain
MTVWLLYAVAVTLAFGAAATLLEAVVITRGGAARLLWLAALTASVVTGVLAPVLLPSAPTATAWGDVVAVSGITGAGDVARPGSSWSVFATGIRPRLDAVLPVVWLASSLLFGVNLLVATGRARGLRRTGRIRRLGGVRIVQDAPAGPAAAGVLRPWILLPQWTRSLPRRQHRLMLAHEVEHVRTGDPGMRLAAGLLVALMPLNPGAWWMRRRLDAAMELDCDARVLRRCGRAADYARLLLDMATRRQALHAVGAVQLTGNLERRVLAMTRPALERPGSKLRVMAAAAVIATLSLLDMPSPPWVGQSASRLTGALHGTVVDSSGAPVAAAGIASVIPVAASDTATTPPPAPLRSRVAQSQPAVEEAAAPGGSSARPSEGAGTPVPAASDAARSEVLPVGPSQPFSTNTTVGPPTPTPVPLPAPQPFSTGPAVVAGRVRDANGVAVARAHIRVVGTRRSTVSDREGRYLLHLGRQDTYSLTISAPGFRDAEASALQLPAGHSVLDLVMDRQLH